MQKQRVGMVALWDNRGCRPLSALLYLCSPCPYDLRWWLSMIVYICAPDWKEYERTRKREAKEAPI